MTKGKTEAKDYIYSGCFRRDLENRDVSSKAIDYIIFCFEMCEPLQKQINKIKKIIKE